MMVFLVGFLAGYFACKYQAPIVAWIKNKISRDDDSPPGFV